MNIAEALGHLQTRAGIQRAKHRASGGRNTLRWNLRDIEAVERIVGELVRIAAERRQAEQPDREREFNRAFKGG